MRRTTVAALPAGPLPLGRNHGLAGIRHEPIQIVGVRCVTLLEITIFNYLGRRPRRREEAVIFSRLGAILVCCEHGSALLERGSATGLSVVSVLVICRRRVLAIGGYGDDADKLIGAVLMHVPHNAPHWRHGITSAISYRSASIPNAKFSLSENTFCPPHEPAWTQFVADVEERAFLHHH